MKKNKLKYFLVIAAILVLAFTVACEGDFKVPEHNVKFYNGETLVYEVTVRSASLININDVNSRVNVKDGYDFLGFYSADGTPFSKSMKLDADMAFYAKTELITYTITYDVKDAAGCDNPTSYTVETETFTLSDPYGYDEDLIFVGWTYGDSASPEKSVTVQKGTTGDLTFEAHYQETDKYYLYFDTQGGSEIERMESRTPTFTMPDTEPQKVGYTFNGWYKDENLQVPVRSVYLATSRLSTVYAAWKPVEYKIEFENCDLETIKYTVETETFTVPRAVKDGYTFKGYLYGGMTSPIKDIEIEKGTHKDYLLTAVFELNSYTIIFETFGGSEIEPITAHFGDEITAPADPEKENCTFLGWYTDELCKNEFTFDTMPAEDITLYAGWYSSDNYTLTYSVTSGVRAEIDGNRASGSKVLAGETVTLKVPSIAYGGVFSHWYYVQGGVSFTYSYDTDLSFDMPAKNLTLVAEYDEVTSFDYVTGGDDLKITSSELTRIFGNGIDLTDYSYSVAAGTMLSATYLNGLSDGEYLFSAIKNSDTACAFIVSVSGVGDKLTFVKLDYDTYYPQVALVFDEKEGYDYEYKLNSATYSECHSGMILADFNKQRSNSLTVRRVDDTSDNVYLDKAAYGVTNSFYYTNTYSYNGKTYDYVIEDSDEMKAMMEYFAFVYAVDEVNRVPSTGYDGGEADLTFLIESNFRKDFSDNKKSYEEYVITEKGVPYSPYYSFSYQNATGLETVKFYFHNKAFNTVASSQEKIELSDTEKLNVPLNKRANDYDDFPIENNSVTQEIRSVYELENLNIGIKPVFAVSSGIAYEVYTAAKDVLRVYVADDMTDHQKVCAIYDYLAKNVTYDNAVANYAGTDRAYGKFSCFTSYGALVNNVAVCDGISSAFRVLCLIEGIECEEIIGCCDVNGSVGGHAWNKVRLNGTWYGVDATWSNMTVSSETYIYHNNFMLSEADLYIGGHRENSSLDNGSVVEGVVKTAAYATFSYYDVEIYGTGLTRNIKRTNDLKELVKYVRSLGGNTVEIKNSTTPRRSISELLNRADVSGSYSSLGNDCYLIFFN
ncbi:MAG: InlB B-repeat-containing protein [Clostridia bacterium]|nr:InlB B-repeat-containing protein [Clostridia bacterium]